MQRAVFASLLALFAPILVLADEPVINEAIRKYADAVERATEQLKTVVDADSAKKAAEILVRLDNDSGEHRDLWLKAAKTEKAGGAVLKHSDDVAGEFEIAWSRVVDCGNPGDILNKLPNMRRVVVDRAASRRPGLVATIGGAADAKKDQARIRAIALATATQAYLIKTEKPPETLQQLVEPPGGGRPYVAKEDLLDPWGLPFQYDVMGPKNNGLKPDVWSIGPDANDPKGRIGNWPRPREIKKDN